MRDAQIEAIKVYLFLKIACECNSLAQLFCQGFFNSIGLNEIELSKSTREYLFQNPAAAALFEYARLTNDRSEVPLILMNMKKSLLLLWLNSWSASCRIPFFNLEI